MREIIQIQVGQCGNQIGYKFWEIISKEHCIMSDGSLGSIHTLGADDYKSKHLEVFYREEREGNYKARNIMIDLEPDSLDKLHSQDYSQLFDIDNYVFGKESASHNWAMGYYREGTEEIEYSLDVVRKELERCDLAQGIQLVHSLGGGTGGGFGSLLIENLKDLDRKLILKTFSVFGNPDLSGVAGEPYNSALSMYTLIEKANIVHILDNDSMMNLLYQTKQEKFPGGECNQEDVMDYMNHLAGLGMAGITSMYRFPDPLFSSTRSFSTNMIPFPRLHFFTVGITHLPNPPKLLPIHNKNKSPQKEVEYTEIAQRIQNGKFCLSGAHPTSGVYINLTAQIRSSQACSEGRILELVKTLNGVNPSNFSDWIADNIKASVYFAEDGCDNLVNSATFFGNSTGLRTRFETLCYRFDQLYKRKAFMRPYRNAGLDVMELEEAKLNVKDLIAEYQMYQALNEEEDDILLML